MIAIAETEHHPLLRIKDKDIKVKTRAIEAKPTTVSLQRNTKKRCWCRVKKKTTMMIPCLTILMKISNKRK